MTIINALSQQQRALATTTNKNSRSSSSSRVRLCSKKNTSYSITNAINKTIKEDLISSEEKKGKKISALCLASIVAVSLTVADCSLFEERARAFVGNEVSEVAARGGGGRSMRGGQAPRYRGTAAANRRAPPARGYGGGGVMPIPVPMFSPFGFGMPFFGGFGYGMPFGFFGGGFILQLFLLAFVVNAASGFFQAKSMDAYERDEWERDNNKSIDDDDFSDDWRNKRR